MTLAYVVVVAVLAVLVVLASRKPEISHADVMRLGWRQLRPLLIRLPVALVAVSFLVALIPREWIASTMGEASGLTGILAASALGGLLPGGPMVSFPVALVIFRAGVGIPAMVALLTAWSVLAIHRVLAFELPMMGWPFVWRRLLASLLLAPLAGVLALVVTSF